MTEIDTKRTKIRMTVNHNTDKVMLSMAKGTQSMNLELSVNDAQRLANKIKEICDPESRLELEL
jgi:hypothetical protein